jgi:hypothetical protein
MALNLEAVPLVPQGLLDDITSILPHNTAFAWLCSTAVVANNDPRRLIVADLPLSTINPRLAQRIAINISNMRRKSCASCFCEQMHAPPPRTSTMHKSRNYASSDEGVA